MGFAQPDGFPVFPGALPQPDGTPQSLWALPRRCHTQSQWGSSHPSRWLPQAPDSESINLAAAAAALDTFQIGFYICPPFVG